MGILVLLLSNKAIVKMIPLQFYIIYTNTKQQAH